MDASKWKGWLLLLAYMVFAEAISMGAFAVFNHFAESKDRLMPFSAGSVFSCFCFAIMLSWKKHPASVRAVYWKVILVSILSMIVGSLSAVLGFSVLGFLVGMASVALALCALNWLGQALNQAKKDGTLPTS